MQSEKVIIYLLLFVIIILSGLIFIYNLTNDFNKNTNIIFSFIIIVAAAIIWLLYHKISKKYICQ